MDHGTQDDLTALLDGSGNPVLEIRCQFIILGNPVSVHHSREIRCQFIILARKDGTDIAPRSSGKGNPVSGNPEIRCQFIGNPVSVHHSRLKRWREIRCRKSGVSSSFSPEKMVPTLRQEAREREIRCREIRCPGNPGEIRCQFIILAGGKSGVSSSFSPGEIRCQFIILAGGNPVSGEIRCQFIILARKDGTDIAPRSSGEIRCQFIILARKDGTDIAPRSSGKEDSRKLETFQMEPCG